MGKTGMVNGAWGDCITAAVIFEHENPAWDQLGPYAQDGPAGQVLAYLCDLGYGDKEGPLAQTEEATHQAVDSRAPLPVYDKTFYQAPVQVVNAPQVNQSPPRPSGRKKALLIGCNYPGQSGQLSGCINDTHRWRQLLVSQYGFPQENIVQLMDEGVNDYMYVPLRSNMIAATRWLVEGAMPGDMLFFQFSGHGGQRESEDCSEADGMDEVLIPTDYHDAGVIVDHELFDLLVVPLPSGCKLTVIMDCCHSGSALDLPFVWNERSNNWDIEAYPWHTAGDVQMFSGCEDAQCSMDVTRHGQAGGAMTTAMCDVLEKQHKQKSAVEYPELLIQLRGVLEQRGFDQKPKLSSSQPFSGEQKKFTLADGHVTNLNKTLGQQSAGKARPPRKNAEGFKW